MSNAVRWESLLTLTLNDMSHIMNEVWADNRRAWLEDNGRGEDDVQTDSAGEYIQDEGERVHLPAMLQLGFDLSDYKLD